MSENIGEKIDPTLEGATPTRLWEIFDMMRRIPRRSGEEAKVMSKLEELAHGQGFETKRDAIGNLCVKVPASPGYEAAPPVILQGHIDMVCVAKDGVKHDFSNDPISLVREGNLLKAAGTSLGADNGIGVAAAMAVASDPSAIHPPLEILVTVDEEVGMSGAEQLDPKALGIQGSLLVNLDTEELGEVYVSSSALDVVTADQSFERDAWNDLPGKFFEISLAGLYGGHSGGDIEKNRGNAILILNSVLKELPDDVRLVSFDGGQKINAIPFGAKAVIFVPESFDAEELTRNIRENLLKECEGLDKADPKINIVEKPRTEVQIGLISQDIRRQVLTALGSLPNGVFRMADELDPELVALSSNIGILRAHDDALHLEIAPRGKEEDEMAAVSQEIRVWLEENGFEVTVRRGAPAWRTDPDSALTRGVLNAFEAVSGGAKAKLTGVHGGLELTYIADKVAAAIGEPVEATTFGPTIRDAHSFSEAVDVESVAVFYAQLCELLRVLTATASSLR